MTDDINENSVESRAFSWWERLKCIFINPSKAFENLKQHPKVLFPMLVIPIGILLLSLPTMGLLKEFLRDAMMQQYATMGMEVPPMVENLLSVQAYSTIIIAAVSIIIVWVVKSAIINGFSGFVNGTGTFKQSLSVIAYAYLPVLLGSVIVTILQLITGEYNIMTSFAILLPESMTGGFIYTVFANLDVFIIWYQILAIIGISKVYNVSKKSSSILVIGTWIVFILISSGIGAASNMAIKGMM